MRSNQMWPSSPAPTSCGARTRYGTPCPEAPLANGRCRLHGGLSPGAPKGNQHARKHGFHSADEIARRRGIATLLRNMHALAAAVSSGRRV